MKTIRIDEYAWEILQRANEIARTEDGQWRSYGKNTDEYGKVHVFRFIKNGQDYFP